MSGRMVNAPENGDKMVNEKAFTIRQLPHNQPNKSKKMVNGDKKQFISLCRVTLSERSKAHPWRHKNNTSEAMWRALKVGLIFGALSGACVKNE